MGNSSGDDVTTPSSLSSAEREQIRTRYTWLFDTFGSFASSKDPEFGLDEIEIETASDALQHPIELDHSLTEDAHRFRASAPLTPAYSRVLVDITRWRQFPPERRLAQYGRLLGASTSIRIGQFWEALQSQSEGVEAVFDADVMTAYQDDRPTYFDDQLDWPYVQSHLLRLTEGNPPTQQALDYPGQALTLDYSNGVFTRYTDWDGEPTMVPFESIMYGRRYSPTELRDVWEEHVERVHYGMLDDDHLVTPQSFGEGRIGNFVEFLPETRVIRGYRDETGAIRLTNHEIDAMLVERTDFARELVPVVLGSN